jgi:sulfofructose kinase
MSHTVYSYGVVSSSTVYSLSDTFPSAEGYAEIDDIRHMTGGEAANSSIVLSRLGVRVKLDGNWLGDDEPGRRTKALLSDQQVDTSRLLLKPGYEGVQEVVFSAAGTRTIFGTYGRLLEEAGWNMPKDEDIVQAKVVCLDPFFSDPASRVAEIACNADVPVVTVDCKFDDPLLKHTSAVVIAESYIGEQYPGADREELFDNYRAATNGLVIFTFGDVALWYARSGEPVKHFQPYPIEPVDTTGGGDSFRAGIVYGFLQSWNDERTVEFAAAVAAINCTRRPGVLNSPSHDEVAAFLRSAGAGSLPGS